MQNWMWSGAVSSQWTLQYHLWEATKSICDTGRLLVCHTKMSFLRLQYHVHIQINKSNDPTQQKARSGWWTGITTQTNPITFQSMTYIFVWVSIDDILVSHLWQSSLRMHYMRWQSNTLSVTILTPGSQDRKWPFITAPVLSFRRRHNISITWASCVILTGSTDIKPHTINQSILLLILDPLFLTIQMMKHHIH